MVAAGGDLAAALAGLSVVEQAAVAYDWREWWARPKQLAPDGPWRSHGYCTGRRFGKTEANAHIAHEEAMSGRAMRIALIAQNEDRAKLDMVEGASGILQAAPPWERPVWERDRLLWPNGAQAFVFTPEKPGDVRGPGVHLAWASEIAAWPPTKRAEAWSNLRFMTSLGYARLIWDTTPKKRHPILRSLLWRAENHGDRHHVVRGSSHENAANINTDELAEWQAEWGGTTKGREELEGEYLDDVDGALVRPEWIDAARRVMPHRLERRIISIDPAISTRRNTDATGIAELGLGTDAQIYVIDDLTGHWSPEEWARKACERYVASHCDCLVVERNRGGDLNVGNLRAWGRMQTPAVQVVVVKDEASTRWVPGTIYVKEVTARGSKESRLDAVSPLYEKGRVSHVDGADLADAEEELTTWEPEEGMPSPNRVDAIVQGCWELAGLGRERVRRAATAAGYTEVRAALKSQVASPFASLMRRDAGRAGRL